MPSMQKVTGLLSGVSGVDYFDSRAIKEIFRLSSTELFDRRRLGLFPNPDLKLGYRTHLWKRDTIAEWIKNYPFAETAVK